MKVEESKKSNNRWFKIIILVILSTAFREMEKNPDNNPLGASVVIIGAITSFWLLYELFMGIFDLASWLKQRRLKPRQPTRTKKFILHNKRIIVIAIIILLVLFFSI